MYYILFNEKQPLTLRERGNEGNFQEVSKQLAVLRRRVLERNYQQIIDGSVRIMMDCQGCFEYSKDGKVYTMKIKSAE